MCILDYTLLYTPSSQLQPRRCDRDQQEPAAGRTGHRESRGPRQSHRHGTARQLAHTGMGALTHAWVCSPPTARPCRGTQGSLSPAASAAAVYNQSNPGVFPASGIAEFQNEMRFCKQRRAPEPAIAGKQNFSPRLDLWLSFGSCLITGRSPTLGFYFKVKTIKPEGKNASRPWRVVNLVNKRRGGKTGIQPQSS